MSVFLFSRGVPAERAHPLVRGWSVRRGLHGPGGRPGLGRGIRGLRGLPEQRAQEVQLDQKVQEEQLKGKESAKSANRL